MIDLTKLFYMNFVLWLLTVLSAGAAAYVGAYLKRKGENIATREDFDNLVKQVKATTEATKAIEARITDEFWNKQRLWEMRRDTLRSAINTLSTVHYTLCELANHAEQRTKLRVPDESALRARKESMKTLAALMNDLVRVELEVTVVCRDETGKAFRKVTQDLGKIFLQIENEDVESAVNVTQSTLSVIRGIVTIIRDELEIVRDAPSA